jgi:pyruvate,water dikinase
MEMTRGLPYNVTTEMDLALWEMAKVIRTDTDSMQRFEEANINELVADYQASSLPAASQDAIERFLALYGLRGVGEIDMGRPRWYEDPTYIFQVLKSYMRIDESAAPDVVFQRGVEKANQAQEKLLAAFRAARGGAMRSLLARFMARRLRELGGLREVPKFAVVRWLGVWHEVLLAAGMQLVDKGILAEPEDIFFLHLTELKEDMEIDWKALVAERRAVHDREMRRRRVPRVLLSDGTAFYDGASAASGDGAHVLRGSPVSPGVVEGVVRVVLDPHGAQLNPGDILVCPATDPAWTPLFLAVDGLVMEVGGMMQHGAVVAREYGIPAVVGVDQATTRLQTGQRIRVDGSNGVVTILQPEAEG